MPRGGSSSLTAERRRARAAERRAHTAAERARTVAAGVSPDRDLEGDCARCAEDASTAHRKCGEQVRKCDEAAHVDRYADRGERRDAARDAAGHASRAEMYAGEAENAADGAEWSAERMAAGDREVAATGAEWGTTFRGWNRRSR